MLRECIRERQQRCGTVVVLLIRSTGCQLPAAAGRSAGLAMPNPALLHHASRYRPATFCTPARQVCRQPRHLLPEGRKEGRKELTRAPLMVVHPALSSPLTPSALKALLMTSPQNGATSSDQSVVLMSAGGEGRRQHRRREVL